MLCMLCMLRYSRAIVMRPHRRGGHGWGLRRQRCGIQEAVGIGVLSADRGLGPDAGADARDLVVVERLVADEGGRDGMQLGYAALEQPPHALLGPVEHRHHLHKPPEEVITARGRHHVSAARKLARAYMPRCGSPGGQAQMPMFFEVRNACWWHGNLMHDHHALGSQGCGAEDGMGASGAREWPHPPRHKFDGAAWPATRS